MLQPLDLFSPSHFSSDFASSSENSHQCKSSGAVTALNQILLHVPKPSLILELSLFPLPDPSMQPTPSPAFAIPPHSVSLLLSQLSPQQQHVVTLAPDVAQIDNDTNVLYDHVAHAVPGCFNYLTDPGRRQRGVFTLDGRPSQSNYFASDTPLLGLIVAWTLFDQSGNILAEFSMPSLTFPFEFITVTLVVEDDPGNKHQKTTTVTTCPSNSEEVYF